MDFVYEGTGNIKISGCAIVSATFCEVFAFAIGSTVYACQKACQRGFLEPVCIKSVRILKSQASQWGCFPPPDPKKVMYIDTYNTIWEERELCTHAQAIEHAIAYWQRLAEEAEALDC
jgi:hypothetical protein